MFFPNVQHLIANQPDHFILHGFLCRIVEMDRHLVICRANSAVYNGGVFALFLDRTDKCLSFLRIGRSPGRLSVSSF